jgi:hypothetical protein
LQLFFCFLYHVFFASLYLVFCNFRVLSSILFENICLLIHFATFLYWPSFFFWPLYILQLIWPKPPIDLYQ